MISSYLTLVFSLLLFTSPSFITSQCPNLDPKKITLITFDVFAALMDTPKSMTQNLGGILPLSDLPLSQHSSFVNDWLNIYANQAGMTFNQAIHQPQPFQWTIRTALVTILKSRGLISKYPVNSLKFNQLLLIWGKLIPRPGTQAALLKLQNAGYTLGVLSNGDLTTLNTAIEVFQPTVKITKVFSSNYPVGAYKPNIAMYNQVSAVWDKTKILHIAGSPIDAKGARDAGLYSGLLYYPALSANPQPCFVLSDITLLPAKLGITTSITQQILTRIRNWHPFTNTQQRVLQP